MIFLKYILPLSFLFFVGISSSENPENDSDRISWDKDQQLKWDDFKGVPDNSNELDAYTMLGISLEVMGQKDGQVDMGVFGYFEKNKSWVKVDEKTDYLLAHEQKHFDLCEIYRRKLIQTLEAKKTYSFDTFSDQIGKIFNQVFEDYTKEQARYDEETNHSQKKEAQKRWNKFISKELSRLKKYDKIAANLNVK